MNMTANPPPESVEDKLRLHDRAMGASSCGITIADASLPDMPLIYVNDAFEHITGYPVPEVVGRNCRFLQGNDRDQPGVALVRDALRAGKDCTVVLRNYRKDGTLFWNELFMSPIYSDGRLTHYVGIQTDVTPRKRAEEELVRSKDSLERTLRELRDTQAMLIHSEKMNALGQLVAGVAHEINNPVSFVNSNLHSLRTSMDDFFTAYTKLETLLKGQGIEMENAAQAIRAQADVDFLQEDVGDLLTASLRGLGRVTRIVQALRTFSRLDEADLKVADLRENIESTLILARAEMRDRVTVELDMEALPPIRCYPAELNQVFLNIVVNAAQAIEGEGKLTIRGRDAGKEVMLQFIDTGTGMSPDVMAQIFHPFFTTKPIGVGTGLGLSIAYKIITDRHKGRIEVSSTPGAGSTFTLILPKDVES
jgi:PAS domain S-box-containing protein